MYSFRYLYRTCCHKRKLFHIDQSLLIKSYQTQIVPNINKEIPQNDMKNFFSFLSMKLKKYNRIYIRDFETTLKIIQPENANEATFLLGCFGNIMPNVSFEEKMKLSEIFMESLEKNGLCLTTKHYNTLLKSLIENGTTIDHVTWLQNLSSKSLKPDSETFQILLSSAAKYGNTIVVSDIIEKIKFHGYFITSSIYNKLIQASAASGDESWRDLMNSLKKSGFSPSFDTYVSAMIGLSRSGNITSIQRIYDEIHTLRPIKMESIISIIDTLVENNHLENTFKVFEWMNITEDPEDQIKIKLIAIKMIHKGEFQIALSLVNYLPERNIRFQFTFQLLQEMINSNSPIDQILFLISHLTEMEKNNLKTDLSPGSAISRTIGTAFHFKKYEIARALLVSWHQKGEILRPHYFWPLLVAYRIKESENGIISILNLMNDLKVNIDTQTLIDFVLPYIFYEDPENLIKFLHKYVSSISNKNLITAVIAVLLNKGQFNKAIKLCSTNQTKLKPEFLIIPLLNGLETRFENDSLVYFLKRFKNDKPNIDWTGELLLKIIFNNKIGLSEEEIDKLFKILQLWHLGCSSEAASLIAMELGSKARDLFLDWNLELPSNDSYIHPKDMTKNQLESHRAELEGKNLDSKGILRKLLLNYYHEGDYENASMIYKEFLQKFGFTSFTPACLTAYFHILTIDGNLKDAEKLYESIYQYFPNVPIDNNKIFDFAILLAKNERIEDAITFIKNNIQIKQHFPLKKFEFNCWNLLNAISNSTSPEAPKKLEEIFQLLCSYKIGDLKKNAKVLSPFVHIHLKRGDYEKAVDTYEYFVENYQKTPHELELVHTLAKEMSANRSDAPYLLDRVLKATSEIHGFKSSIATLATVFAKEGLVNTLLDLLKSNGKIIYCDEQSMYFKYKHLASEGHVEALNNLLEAFIKRGAQDLENIQCLLEFIFEAYRINRDSEGVINLWTRIHNENLIIDDCFRNRIKFFMEAHLKQKSISPNS